MTDIQVEHHDAAGYNRTDDMIDALLEQTAQSRAPAVPDVSSDTGDIQPRAAKQIFEGTPESIDATNSPPRAHVDDVQFVSAGSLNISSQNFWSSDIIENADFARLLAVARTPTDLEPMLVIPEANGWAIVGDPSPLLAVQKLHPSPDDQSSIQLPVRQILGTEAAIVFHTAEQALRGRPFKNIRRARLALRVCETEGLEGKMVAARLGLDASGTSRDLKAARMEREYPALAEMLVNPSEAPVSYYNDMRDFADRQPAPDRAMADLVAAAKRLVKAGKRFKPAEAKLALKITKPAKAGGAGTSAALRRDITVGAGTATVEADPNGATRLILALPACAEPFDDQVRKLQLWLNSASPLPLAE